MNRKKMFFLLLSAGLIVVVVVGWGMRGRSGGGPIAKERTLSKMQTAPAVAVDIVAQEIQATRGYLDGQTEHKLLIAILGSGTDFLIKSYSASSSGRAPNEQRLNSEHTTLALKRAMTASNKLYVAARANDRAKISVLLGELKRASVDLSTAVKKK